MTLKKTCQKCGVTYPLFNPDKRANFQKQPCNSGGYDHWCKTCRNAQKRGMGRIDRQSEGKAARVGAMIRECLRCGHEFEARVYSRRSDGSPENYDRMCRPCRDVSSYGVMAEGYA